MWFDGVFRCPGYARFVPVQYLGLPSGSYGYNRAGVAFPGGGLIDGDGAPPRNQQFGLGGEILERPVRPERVRTIRPHEVIHPVEMLAVGDSVIWKGESGGREAVIGMSDLSLGMGYPALVAHKHWPYSQRRHAGNWNVLFCDGHARAMRPSQLFAYRTDEVRRLWNNDHEPHREFPPLWPPDAYTGSPYDY
jgi:prepilin-type processing-associated H-X9-DG protein